MKKLITNYTFNAAAKTITFTDYGSITLEGVLLITNVTDKIVIYDSETYGGIVATNVLTLDYNTTSMDNADDLQIFYDDTAVNFATSEKQDTIIGHVDGIETLLGTIDADTSALVAKDFATQTTLAAINGKLVSGTDIGDVTINNAAGASAVNIQDGGNSITVDGTVSANQSGTWNITNISGTISLPTGAATETTLSSLNGKITACNTGAVVIGSALPAGANNIGDVDVLTLPALPTGTNTIGSVKITDGTNTASVRDTGSSDSLNVAIVDASGNQITSFGGGTQYTEGDIDASITGTAIMWEDTSDTLRPVSAAKPLPVNITNTGVAVAGDVAHDSANSGNPVQIGVEAIAHGTNPTAVAAGDRTKLYANRAGIPFVIGGHPNIITLEASYTAAQTNTAIVSVSSGAKIVVTQIKVVTSAFSPNVVSFRIGFAASTTPTTTGVVESHPGMIPGATCSRGDGNAILGVGADGEDLRITCTTPGTSGEIRVIVSYYTIES